MAFSTANTNAAVAQGGGETNSNYKVILTSTNFENGLIAGRFAKLDTGRLDNMDGSASPVVAGVVLRDPANAVEDGATYDSTLYSQVDFQRAGLVTVNVLAGDTPAQFGRVFVNNTGVNAGLATTNTGGVAVAAEFIREVRAGVWLINLTPPNGDVAFPFNTQEVADGGNASALPANRSANVNIVTTGAQTRTLAAPTASGFILMLNMQTDGGDCVVTVASAINATGNNTITLNDAGDSIVLYSARQASAFVWRVMVNNGTTLTTV